MKIVNLKNSGWMAVAGWGKKTAEIYKIDGVEAKPFDPDVKI